MAGEPTSGGDPARSLALLWRTPQAATRGRPAKLSVERIVEAAVAVADDEGLPALSMRRVAERLGVGTMSLYTHVPGKEELLDVMLDAVYAEATGPLPATEGWRAALERVARDDWALYQRHPWVLQVNRSRPLLGPNVIAKYERDLRTIDGIGLDDVEMDSVISLVTAHTESAARRAVEAVLTERRTGQTDAEWWEATAPLLERVLDARRFPVASRVGTAAGVAHDAASSPEHDFEFGLARVLDGIEALVRSRSQRS
jgi:AcrR family transcriptional regulator